MRWEGKMGGGERGCDTLLCLVPKTGKKTPAEVA